MTDKIITAFSKLIWDSDLIASRFTLALSEFLWASMLLWPGDSFERPVYHNLKYFAIEELWGSIFLITGILQLSIVFSKDLHSTFARIFSAYNAFLWLFVIGGIVVSVFPPPAALGGEMALTVTAVWIWLRPYILARGIRNDRK